ncbi:hypothetical protein HDK90DRAFT_467637 [Phyllosticta capitalensis]|uniref:Uncharacterized protein n=1 Tax=Phyllosticta capitalensis TaxID=121624 RepID=A0ABR1YL51_9PEZI
MQSRSGDKVRNPMSSSIPSNWSNMPSKRPGIAESDSASGAKRARVENSGPIIIDLTSSASSTPEPEFEEESATAESEFDEESPTPEPDLNDQLDEALTNLNPELFEGILRQFAPQFPALRDCILRKYMRTNRTSLRVASKCSTGKKSSSRQFDLADDVDESIDNIICSISKKASKYPSYGTRKNAIMTLRKIGKSIALSVGVIPREVRKSYDSSPNNFDDAFLYLAKSFKSWERASILKEQENIGSFEDKLVELIEDSRGYCIFPGLERSLRVLRGRG